MLEGNYEEAPCLYIERTRNGTPLISYPGLRVHYFALKSLPEYATLENLIQQWRKEQRTLYDELTATRASSKDTAHP